MHTWDATAFMLLCVCVQANMLYTKLLDIIGRYSNKDN